MAHITLIQPEFGFKNVQLLPNRSLKRPPWPGWKLWGMTAPTAPRSSKRSGPAIMSRCCWRIDYAKPWFA